MKWIRNLVTSLRQAALRRKYDRERMQESKRQSRFTYRDGPMIFLAQQIVKAMQDAGYPATIFNSYRSPEQQNREYLEGDSKAKAWQSPHQFLEAVDIVHPGKFWNVSEDYWETLHACGKIVEERFGVDLVFGYDWGWDKAHIELADWKSVARDISEKTNGVMRPPTPKELWQRFEAVLPRVAKQHRKSVYFQEPRA